MAHHPFAELLLWFVIGQSVYMLKRFYYAKTNPDNPVSNLREWLSVEWMGIAFRMFVAQMIFWILVTNPDMFSKAISLFGLSWDWDLPVNNPAGAMGFGLIIEVILDWARGKSQKIADFIPAIGFSKQIRTVDVKTTEEKITDSYGQVISVSTFEETKETNKEQKGGD